MKILKKINFQYEEITNIDDLIEQLEELKHEAFIMLPTKEPIFKKDYIALSTIITFLKENKEVITNEKNNK